MQFLKSVDKKFIKYHFIFDLHNLYVEASNTTIIL